MYLTNLDTNQGYKGTIITFVVQKLHFVKPQTFIFRNLKFKLRKL